MQDETNENLFSIRKSRFKEAFLSVNSLICPFNLKFLIGFFLIPARAFHSSPTEVALC